MCDVGNLIHTTVVIKSTELKRVAGQSRLTARGFLLAFSMRLDWDSKRPPLYCYYELVIEACQ